MCRQAQIKQIFIIIHDIYLQHYNTFDTLSYRNILPLPKRQEKKSGVLQPAAENYYVIKNANHPQ